MPRLTTIRCTALCLCAAAALAATTGGTAKAASSCGIYAAAGHQFIVVAMGMPCTAAKAIVARLAARTAALHVGQTVTVAHPPTGYVCVIQNRAKPAGSCNHGPTKMVTWLVAA